MDWPDQPVGSLCPTGAAGAHGGREDLHRAAEWIVHEMALAEHEAGRARPVTVLRQADDLYALPGGLLLHGCLVRDRRRDHDEVEAGRGPEDWSS